MNSDAVSSDSMLSVEESRGYKVFKLTLIQLIITFALCSLAYLNATYRGLIYGEGSIYICFILAMVLFVLVCLLKNLTSMKIFMLTLANLTAADCSVFYEVLSNGGVIVLYAASITLVVILLLTKYAELS